MNVDIATWNNGLLFAGLCVILGIVGVVSIQHPESRWLASGMFLQGVVLTFTVGAAYFHHAVELQLACFAVVGLLIVQSLYPRRLEATDTSPTEDDQP